MELSLLLMQSILSMALIVAAGWLTVKLGVVRTDQAPILTDFCLYVSCPCLLLTTFQADFTLDKFHGLLLATGAGLLMHGIGMAVARLAARPFGLDGVERGVLIYPNAGNLLVPLVISLLGGEYVLYSAPIIAVQTVLFWTHYVRLVQPDSRTDLRQILRNPNILAIGAGLVFFFTDLHLPGVLAQATANLGACLGPVSMFSIGILMAQIRWREVFGSLRVWLLVLGRLLLIPALFIGAAALLGAAAWFPGVREVLLVAALSSSAPVAVMVCQIAERFGADSAKASAANVLSMLLSILTMPVLAGLYQWLC